MRRAFAVVFWAVAGWPAQPAPTSNRRLKSRPPWQGRAQPVPHPCRAVDFQDGRELKREASHGTIIAPEGLVINHHVADAPRITCTLANRKRSPPSLWGPTPRISPSRLRPQPRDFPSPPSGRHARRRSRARLAALALSQSVDGHRHNTEMIMPGMFAVQPDDARRRGRRVHRGMATTRLFSAAIPAGPSSTCRARSSASTRSVSAWPERSPPISPRKWPTRSCATAA
jgi:hypothetical protein